MTTGIASLDSILPSRDDVEARSVIHEIGHGIPALNLTDATRVTIKRSRDGQYSCHFPFKLGEIHPLIAMTILAAGPMVDAIFASLIPIAPGPAIPTQLFEQIFSAADYAETNSDEALFGAALVKIPKQHRYIATKQALKSAHLYATEAFLLLSIRPDYVDLIGRSLLSLPDGVHFNRANLQWLREDTTYGDFFG